MAQTSRASSVQGVALRVTRLNADGTPGSGDNASYILNRLVTVSYTPEYSGGQTIDQQLANGEFSTNYQTPDVFQRITVAMQIADPDPEFSEIAAGGTIFTDGVTEEAIGWSPEDTGEIAVPNGVALEVWSLAIEGNRRALTNPYFLYLFPRVYLHASADKTFENSVLNWSFEGFGDSNPNFGAGAGDWQWTSDRPYQHARVASAPTGINGYQTL